MLKHRYFLLLAAFIFSGCVSARHAVPEGLLGSASIYGFKDIRAIGGLPSDSFKKDFLDILERGEKGGPGFISFRPGRTYYCLAISGGAANGAYGAGLLNGWSVSGKRPVFEVVTGISTGAIIAPFAFLGSKYDGRLKEFYTKYSTCDVIRIRFPRFRILFSDSVAVTFPLENLIRKYVDQDVLKEVAAQHRRGRRLYVGTTNLDAQRLVIWDMGKIASVGSPEALELFRRIILASASVPVAFPPVYFDVEAEGKRYDEMHVDGGISKQVFFLYDVLQGFDKALEEKKADYQGKRYIIYIIMNGYLDPLYKEIPDRIFSIAERTIEAMTNSQSIGDLYQIYFFTRDGRGDFNLAYIPADCVFKPREIFDPQTMEKIFDLGYSRAANGYPWRKSPPGIKEEG
ncbi:MAG: patatin-like phospholipase family protein [Candidatus Omnitrophica bacterium]|jgi:hypothetical protein|nr:patatin-like phospholipase family protein [Candidatus Omnitrophota bacterium]